VWSIVFSCIGYGAGRLISQLAAELHRHEVWIAVGLVLIAVGALIWHLGRPKRARASTPPAGQ